MSSIYLALWLSFLNDLIIWIQTFGDNRWLNECSFIWLNGFDLSSNGETFLVEIMFESVFVRHQSTWLHLESHFADLFNFLPSSFWSAQQISFIKTDWNKTWYHDELPTHHIIRIKQFCFLNWERIV